MKRLLLLSILIIALPARATQIRRMSLQEIRDRAPAVLVVDVVGASSRIGDAGMVWTDYAARVVEVLRGPHRSGDVVTLSFAAAIAGVPRLHVGLRYAIFLDDAPARPVPVIGWGQGIVPVAIGEELEELRRFVGGASVALPLVTLATSDGHGGSCTCGVPATLPASWEIDHSDPAYAAAAKEVFDRWNQYVDVFAYRAGDGAAAPNGKNEVTMLDIAAASKAYGINMDRDTFAVTYMSPISAAGEFDGCPKPPQTACGTFDETDVIVNADFLRGFKPSGPVDFSDRGPALYAATVAHELGHTLGFHHNVGNISVMNLYEDFAAQYITIADAQEARAAYPSRARAVTDLALYPFYFDAALTDYAATTAVEVTPAVAVPGGTITVRNFEFENVGTEVISSVLIRFYLSRGAEITSSDTLLSTVAFSGPFKAGAWWDDREAGMSLTIPRDQPPGMYFLGALISDGRGIADSVAYNNSWIAPQQISVVSGVRRRAARH